MSRVALDSSALLALFFDEPGSDTVRAALAEGEPPLLSAVNLSEVVARLIQRDVPIEEVERWWAQVGAEVAAFDERAAFATALLKSSTARAGLSLGDRACLALAAGQDRPVMTSDRQWSAVPLGVEVMQIR